MIIRKQQLARFAECMDFRYCDILVGFLREHFPDAAATSFEAMRSEVQQTVTAARRWQFSTERDIAVYVTTVWLLGSDFHERMAAPNQVLNAVDRSPFEKATWLADWTTNLMSALEG